MVALAQGFIVVLTKALSAQARHLYSIDLSFAEFVGLLLGIAVFVILLYIVIYEYRAWRARRLARLVKPAKSQA